MSDPIKFSHRVEAFGYDALTGLLRLLPFRFVSWLGGALLRIIGPMTSKQAIAKTNMRIAFPTATNAQLKTYLRDHWDNTGRTFAEFALTDRIHAFDDGAPRNGTSVTVEELDIFLDNAPAILVSGHFANWEVMAAVLTQSSKPVRVTYRKINNPLIDQRVRAQREAYGTKFLVQKSTHRGGRELFQALRDGESIAIMNDQKFNTGLKLPFFGQDAMTAQGAVRLALKTNRPILPMCVVRDGARFHVKFYPPLDWDRIGNRDSDVEAGVRAVTRFIEDRIRENPAQWFWVHRRWPKPVYKTES
jgi:KDO2-lipid IV(A) lauroyltransferase